MLDLYLDELPDTHKLFFYSILSYVCPQPTVIFVSGFLKYDGRNYDTVQPIMLYQQLFIGKRLGGKNRKSTSMEVMRVYLSERFSSQVVGEFTLCDPLTRVQRCWPSSQQVILGISDPSVEIVVKVLLESYILDQNLISVGKILSLISLSFSL